MRWRIGRLKLQQLGARAGAVRGGGRWPAALRRNRLAEHGVEALKNCAERLGTTPASGRRRATYKSAFAAYVSDIAARSSMATNILLTQSISGKLTTYVIIN